MTEAAPALTDAPTPSAADAEPTRAPGAQSGQLAPLLARWGAHPQTPRLRAAAEAGNALTLAVPEAVRAYWLAALPDLAQRPVVAILPGMPDLERAAADVTRFRAEPAILAPWETLPYEHVSPAIETMGARLATFRAWRNPDAPPPLTLVTIRALLQRVAPSAADPEVIRLAPGERHDLDDLTRRLVALGYERTYQVEARGEFAVRGGILDVYPSTAPQPVRVELWGDEVDTLRSFAVSDQRGIGPLAAVEVVAAREVLPDAALAARAAQLVDLVPGGREAMTRFADGEFFAGMESWLPWLLDGDVGRSVVDLLPADALVVVCDPKRCLDRATDLRNEEEDLARALSVTWQVPTAGMLEAIVDDADDADGPVEAVASEAGPETGVDTGTAVGNVAAPGLTEPPRLFLDAERVLSDAPLVWLAPAIPDSPDAPAVSASVLDQTFGRADDLARRLQELRARGLDVVVAADGSGSQSRMRQALVDEGLALTRLDGPLSGDPTGGVICVAPLQRGFVSAELGLALLSEPDITGRRRAHRPVAATRRRTPGRGGATPVYGDLEPGDYVVHYHHGVGRFLGMASRAIDGVDREYLEVAYAGHDRLYVPIDQVDAVRKYIGGDTPRLSKMGGSDWARTKGKVRKAVAEIAEELVRLYRERLLTGGNRNVGDPVLVSQLESSFPYDETPDQQAAIDAVRGDMAEPVPMDRLVCGDVGFGKTEVAVRAAMQAVSSGYQAAVLVPTTVLAQQHFQTFSDRFADTAVRVEMVSRFLSAKEQKKILASVAAGDVDVLIGTHRLLSKDVGFAKLGLLVVDEEQRFGVKAKEALKELRANVDVLTMTATPIPRTLEFGLTGIRDMSVINTPPEDRQAVLTYVGEFDEQAVAAAIRRELLRDGQVFYVHNRVRSIEKVAAQIRRLVPEARVAIAHGQMDEASLEKVMLAFWDGEYDVLCATTLIESGLDIARANTLIVDRADLLGLAQLYQLRGRVGRSRERAYAYLFYPPNRVLTEEAHERLKVIAEHTELGSGYAIAMRDLELRGAGNLLGASQSGHIAAVGFDLYCELVTAAVQTLQGETPVEEVPVRVDLPIEAYVPDAYMPKESLRLEAYRRLADAHTTDAIADVRDEWIDRYGPIPEEVDNLLELARVRVAALEAGVREIVFARNQARLSPCVPTGSRRMRIERIYKGTVIKDDVAQMFVPWRDPALAGRGAGVRDGVDGRAVCRWMTEVLEEVSGTRAK